MLVADLDIRIIDAATGELLRHLTLDPTRDYQPTGRPPGPPPRKQQPPDPKGGSASGILGDNMPVNSNIPRRTEHSTRAEVAGSDRSPGSRTHPILAGAGLRQAMRYRLVIAGR